MANVCHKGSREYLFWSQAAWSFFIELWTFSSWRYFACNPPTSLLSLDALCFQSSNSLFNLKTRTSLSWIFLCKLLICLCTSSRCFRSSLKAEYKACPRSWMRSIQRCKSVINPFKWSSSETHFLCSLTSHWVPVLNDEKLCNFEHFKISLPYTTWR